MQHAIQKNTREGNYLECISLAQRFKTVVATSQIPHSVKTRSLHFDRHFVVLTPLVSYNSSFMQR